MQFTDIFIKRPVLAIVISILILGFGLRSLYELPLRKFPKMETGLIIISTSYSGANAETVQSFITSPIEKTVASADGVDYITSSTQTGNSTVKVALKAGYQINDVFTNIMAKVAEVRNALPADAEPPVVMKSSGRDMSMMYVSFNSTDMSSQQITNYIKRIIRPKLETIDGVSEVKAFGGSSFAVRVWLNPGKMAAFSISTEEVSQAIKNNQFISQAGQIEDHFMKIDLKASTDFDSIDNFRNIVIKQTENGPVQLKDIARIELGAKNYDYSVFFNDSKAVFIGIDTSPTANPLKVIKEVNKELPLLEKQYPPSLKSQVVFDSTIFIQKSIEEVIQSIIEATVIVLIVIFLFLGSLRAVVIPMVTVPLSLIGVLSVMFALGYSLNLLTLLAMVLAIGLVVDDAIVVLENIHRNMQLKDSKLEAAMIGAREIASPVISMTLTLAAVYTPIAFTGGITGALFKEFALTLAGSVVFSGFIALTLSPMMCANILSTKENKFEKLIGELFGKLQSVYGSILNVTIRFRKTVLGFILLCFFGIYSCIKFIPMELAPTEDEGFIFVSAQAPQYANLKYVERYTSLFKKTFNKMPEVESFFIVNNAKSAFSGVNLVPSDKRSKSPKELQAVLQQEMIKNPGLRTYAIAPGALPMSGGSMPIQFVLSSTMQQKELAPIAETIKNEAMKTGAFGFLNYDLLFNKPSYHILINRDKAASAHISMQQIASALSTFFSNNAINKIQMQGDSYDIIPQADKEYRFSPQEIKNIYVKSPEGYMIPLSSFIAIESSVEPNEIFKFQQLNAVTISGIPAPGHSLSQCLDVIESIASQYAPAGTNFDYMGESRRFLREGNAMQMTFMLALAVIFLVLSAQFESFIAPWIILVTVPLSMMGAIGFLALLQLFPVFKFWHQASTLNIYSDIGLITLVGLIAKHGILLVQFANKMQLEENKSVEEAVIIAAKTRLRPILMTTMAMILGVTPLLTAQGAGALSRMSIGLVLVSGLAFGTVLTLLVLPTLYATVRSLSAVDFILRTSLFVGSIVWLISMINSHFLLTPTSVVSIIALGILMIYLMVVKQTRETHKP